MHGLYRFASAYRGRSGSFAFRDEVRARPLHPRGMWGRCPAARWRCCELSPGIQALPGTALRREMLSFENAWPFCVA